MICNIIIISIIAISLSVSWWYKISYIDILPHVCTYITVYLFLWICSKPELNMLKILSISPSSTSLKITHYSYSYHNHIILYALLFQVLTSRETLQAWYILCSSWCVMTVMYIHIKYNSQWKSSTPFLKFHHLLCYCSSLILIFNNYQLFLNHACEHPIILKLYLWVSYNSQNYACIISNLLFSKLCRHIRLRPIDNL